MIRLIAACIFLCLVGVIGTTVFLNWYSRSVADVFDGYTLWACSPYIGLGCLAYFSKVTLRLRALLLFTLILVLFGARELFYNHMHPDPQGGLIFLFLPLWQWCAILIGLAAFLVLPRVMSFFRK